MKGLTVISPMILLILNASGLAVDHYYYEDGLQIQLTPATEYLVALQDDDQYTTWIDIIGSKGYLDGTFEPFPMADHFMLLRLTGGWPPTGAADDLRLSNGIASVNNVYADPHGGGIFTRPTSCIFISKQR